MIDKEWLLELGATMEVGDSQYLPHDDCTQSNKLWVTRTEGGVYAFCNKCKEERYASFGTRAIDDLYGRGTTAAPPDLIRDEHGRITLPSRHSETRHVRSDVWLLRAGISRSLSEACGIYTDKTGRVVLPLVDNETGEVSYYQARSVDGRSPKYLNPSSGKDSFVSEYGTGSTVTVTEDVLSAIRVGDAGGTRGVPALGTKPYTKLVHFLGKQDTVILWFDPDEEGFLANIRFKEALQWHPCRVLVMRTDKDPKYYSRQEIRDFIKELINGTCS